MKMCNKIPGLVILPVLLVIILFAGCDKGTQPSQSSSEQTVTTGGLDQDTTFKQKGIPAVCLREVNLFEKPDAGSKWLGKLVPGLTINYLNKTETGPYYKDKNGLWVNDEWFYVESPDNKTGWGPAGNIAENAQPAVITEETVTFSMPDKKALGPDKLNPLDAIAVIEEKGEWLKAYKIFEYKSKTYWLLPQFVSRKKADFDIAILFTRATADYNKKLLDQDAYLKSLKNIRTIGGSETVFVAYIEDEIRKLEAGETTTVTASPAPAATSDGAPPAAETAAE